LCSGIAFFVVTIFQCRPKEWFAFFEETHFFDGKNTRQKMKTQISIIAFSLLALAAATHAESPAVKELEAEVAALKKAVTEMKKELSEEISRGTVIVAALQHQINLVESNPALQLGPFVTVDPNPEIGVRGPNITFKGANIHIVSGSGATDDNIDGSGNPAIGLGNLIIGYDEDPGVENSLGSNEHSLMPGDRGGSHNLVIGRWHKFTSHAFGGIVAGELSVIAAEGASVLGGWGNSISGGLSAMDGSILGGLNNKTTNQFATIAGGQENISSGVTSVVCGGYLNNAFGNSSIILGGEQNSTSSLLQVVLGIP
jgi:hypothetical protein